jgi:hypothetical protein
MAEDATVSQDNRRGRNTGNGKTIILAGNGGNKGWQGAGIAE